MSRFTFSLSEAAAPTVAIEIAGHRVSAVSLETRGGRPAIAAHAIEPLPEGALVPALTSANVRDRAAVVSAVGRVLERVGGARRVGLVVPDSVAKVSLVRFQQVPSRAQELEQLIRWQVRKAAPFPIEDAQVAFVRGATSPEGQEFLVSVARRDVIAEYEAVCAAAGAHAGVVDLSTFNVINSVLAGQQVGQSDWLLVNVAPAWASIAVMRGEHLIFFRSFGAETEGTLADLVHQAAMYYEDRLGGSGFGRVLLCGASSAVGRQADDVGELCRSLEDRLKTAIEAVDPSQAAALPDRGAQSPALLDALAPLVGLLVRDRRAA